MSEQQRTRASGAAAVTVGMAALALLMYLFNLIAAHALGPDKFGAVSSYLGITLITNVGALALQATAARRIAVAPAAERDAVAHDVAVSSWQVTAGLTLVAVALSPLLAHLLHTDNVSALLTALAVAPLTMLGGYLGILQGAERWWPLMWSVLVSGAGRVVLGSVALAISRTASGAMAGVLLGAIAPVVVAWWACRDVPHRARGTHYPVLREIWRNAHTLLAYFVMTNLDVLVARNQFDHHTSGLYAAGSLITKACALLPQIVLVVLFPAMARNEDDHGRAWLKPVVAMGAIGLVGVAAAAVLRDLALIFVGGDDYEGMATYAWLFAVEGTAFAVLQVIVYRQIARQAHVAWWMWSAAVVMVALGVFVADGNRALVVIVAVVAAVLTVPVAMAKPRPEDALNP